MVTVVLTWMLVVWNMLIKPSLCNDIGRSFQRLLRTEADGNIKHAVKGASQKSVENRTARDRNERWDRKAA